MSRKESIYKIILQIMAIGLIFGIVLINIQNNTSLKVVGDEFGYWSFAAYLAEYDWSDVASYNNYYGYGYGFLLWPILILPISQTVKYQLATVLNALLLCIAYLCVYKIADKKKDLNYFAKVVISLAVVLCTSNVYYAQFTLAEVLITTLFWAIVYLSIELLENFTNIKLGIYIVLLVYSFAVHQRMLGILIVGLLYSIYILYKNSKLKQSLIYLLLTIILLGIVSYIKSTYKDEYLTNGIVSVLSTNDFSGQIGKVLSLLSFDGMKKLIIGIIGKIYYAYSSTFLFFGIYIYIWFADVFKSFKERKIKKSTIVLTLITLFIVIMMTIDTVFMINYEARFDLILYGRYFEFTIQAAMLIVFLYSYKKIPNYVWSGNMVVYFLLTYVVHHYIPYEQARSHVWVSTPAVANVLLHAEKDIIDVSFGCILCFSILLACKELCKNKFKNIWVVGFLILSLNNACYAYENGCLFWTQSSCLREEELAMVISEIDEKNEIYYYIPENSIAIDFQQFLLGDRAINCISTVDEVNGIGSGEYLITIRNSSLVSDEWPYDNMGGTNYVTLWKHR